MSELREQVRARYAERALVIAGQGAACGDADCCEDVSAASRGAYGAAELASVGMTAAASLGCGNPTLLADLRPGHVVLDLGSGAGLDVLLSARRVSPGGHAYGLDMTDEMLAVANANRERSRLENVTFLKGTIEAIPLPDASVDVVLSNCVINLAESKAAVIAEAFRVLRPGGRLAVSDMIALTEISAAARRAIDLWAGCVSGTISRAEYVAELRAAGFVDIEVEVTREISLAGVTATVASAAIRARKP